MTIIRLVRPQPGHTSLFFIPLLSEMFLQPGNYAFPHPQGLLAHLFNSRSVSCGPHHSYTYPSISGVPVTWLVFIPFASTIGTYWASVLYCVTVTVLEVVFSVGACLLLAPSFSS